MMHFFKIHVLALGIAVIFPMNLTHGFSYFPWMCLTANSEFPARDSAGELVFQEKLWLFGGYNHTGNLNDVWSSEDGLHWTDEGFVPCEAEIIHPISLVFQNRMWVSCIGGEFFSSEDGNHWVLEAENPPWADRTGFGLAGTVFKDHIWVMGGGPHDLDFNPVWSSPNGKDWELVTDKAPWEPRQIFGGLVVFKDRMFLIGGGVSSGFENSYRAFTDIWVTEDGVNWEILLSKVPWQPRIWESMVIFEDTLWLVGGASRFPTLRNFNDIWVSEDGLQWRESEYGSAWTARHESSVLSKNGKLWVIAGNDGWVKNDVWVIQFFDQSPTDPAAGFGGCSLMQKTAWSISGSLTAQNLIKW